MGVGPIALLPNDEALYEPEPAEFLSLAVAELGNAAAPDDGHDELMAAVLVSVGITEEELAAPDTAFTEIAAAAAGVAAIPESEPLIELGAQVVQGDAELATFAGALATTQPPVGAGGTGGTGGDGGGGGGDGGGGGNGGGGEGGQAVEIRGDLQRCLELGTCDIVVVSDPLGLLH